MLPPALRTFFEQQRLNLAAENALLPMAILGALSGLLAGIIMLGFRLLFETAQSQFLPGGGTENYEALSVGWLFALPLAGGLLLGLIFQRAKPAHRAVGVVHVMERLAHHQGHLPWQNALYQFIGASLSIISGHSVGREGPAVHLGAAGGSLLGQVLKLPNNSLSVLIACGTAAAISASFDTPLAGIIFAIEVVLMEYSLHSIAPVIIASVMGALLTRLVYGTAIAFTVPPLSWDTSLSELPYLVLLSLVIGLLAALFIHLLETVSQHAKPHSIWLRLTLAGALTGLVGVFFPHIMGIGYDTVNAALLGDLELGLLLALVFAKLLVTSIGLGLGLPGGLIGPTLFVGAMAGGVLGVIGQNLLGDSVSPPGFYAMLGMGAMMSAVLQAPLAALTALLELTANPHIILPGMLVLILADLVASSPPFRKTSAFLTLMRARGLQQRNDPLSQALRRVGVARLMDSRLVRLPCNASPQRLQQALQEQPQWIVLQDENGLLTQLCAAQDLVPFSVQQAGLNRETLSAHGGEFQCVPLRSTLQKAWEVLEQQQLDKVLVTDSHARAAHPQIYGVLTRAAIEAYYWRQVQ